MTTKTKHTALPFKCDGNVYAQDAFGHREHHLMIEVGPNKDLDVGSVVAKVVVNCDRERENAAFIVRACNNHYQLLEALKYALEWLPKDGIPGQHQDIIRSGRAKIEAAIKAAEGE